MEVFWDLVFLASRSSLLEAKEFLLSISGWEKSSLVTRGCLVLGLGCANGFSNEGVVERVLLCVFLILREVA